MANRHGLLDSGPRSIGGVRAPISLRAIVTTPTRMPLGGTARGDRPLRQDDPPRLQRRPTGEIIGPSACTCRPRIRAARTNSSHRAAHGPDRHDATRPCRPDRRLSRRFSNRGSVTRRTSLTRSHHGTFVTALASRAVLVIGAHRGMDREYVGQLLERGVATVYARSLRPTSPPCTPRKATEGDPIRHHRRVERSVSRTCGPPETDRPLTS